MKQLVASECNKFQGTRFGYLAIPWLIGSRVASTNGRAKVCELTPVKRQLGIIVGGTRIPIKDC